MIPGGCKQEALRPVRPMEQSCAGGWATGEAFHGVNAGDARPSPSPMGLAKLTESPLSEVQAWRSGKVGGMYPDWGTVGKDSAPAGHHHLILMLRRV
jgi:hypothetical protein